MGDTVMKKINFATLVMGTVGGILFAIGMCMCLLPEWGLMTQGEIMGGAGALVLLGILPVRRKMSGKRLISFNGKSIGTALLGVAGALLLGLGMCMTMLWGMMVSGIAVGIVGIVALMCLIPVIKGIERG